MNYDQLMGFLLGNAAMLGVVSVVYTLSKAKNVIFHNPESKTHPLPLNIPKPDIMVVAQLYADGSATIDAKDYMGTPYAPTMQKFATHRTLNALNFFFDTSTPEVEKEAVREASTTLQGVEVEVPQSPVDEGLDVVFPDTPVSKQTKLEDIKAGIQPKGVADAETS
jgi:hypothetical protein